MPRRQPPPESGFLLIDAVIATAILAGAVLACARLIADSTALNATARQTTTCAVLASQKVEELRSRRTLVPETSRENLDEAGGILQPGDIGHRVYVREWNVIPAPQTNLARVEVVVIPARDRFALPAMRPGRGGVVITTMRRMALP